MNALKKLFGGNTRQFGMIFALVALIVFFEIFTEGRTLTSGNVINLFNGNSYILILAIGMVLVIIAGHIDLSVGSVAAFVGVCVALFIRDWGLPWYIGVLMGLGLGVADRCLAGLLGGLRRHSRVHRDAGRHADLPRRQPVRRQVEHHPGPQGLPVHRLRLPARVWPEYRLQQPHHADGPARRRVRDLQRDPVPPQRQGARRRGPRSLGHGPQAGPGLRRHPLRDATSSPPAGRARPSRCRA